MAEEKIKITQLPPQNSNIGEPNRCIIPIVNLDLMQTRKLSLESLLVYFEHLYRDSANTGYIEVNCEGGLEFRDGVSYSTSKVINLGSTVTLTDIDTKTLATSALTAANNVLIKADNANATANVALYRANNAHNKANSAYDYADSAYNLAVFANTIAKTANSRANDTYTVNGTRTNFVKKYEADVLSYQLTIGESTSEVTDNGLKLGDQGYLVCRNTGAAPSQTESNVQILSDWGIGFGSSWTGETVGNKKNAMWINTRTGSTNIYKNLNVYGKSYKISGELPYEYLYDGFSGASFTGYTDVQAFRCTGPFAYTADEPTITLNSNLFASYRYNLRFDQVGSFAINYVPWDNNTQTYSGMIPALYLKKALQVPEYDYGLLFGKRICAMNSLSAYGGTAPNVIGYNTDTSTFDLYYYANASDERIKKIHAPITNATEKLLNLRTVYGEFTKKELKENSLDNGERIFLIAQDVEKEFPGIVYDSEEKLENGEPLKVMYYERLIPALVASIKELKQEIEELKQLHDHQ